MPKKKLEQFPQTEGVGVRPLCGILEFSTLFFTGSRSTACMIFL